MRRATWRTPSASPAGRTCRVAADAIRISTVTTAIARSRHGPVLLGATNTWFPITLSALAIPLARDPISQLVRDGWDYFEDVGSESEVALVVKTLQKIGALPGIGKHSSATIWATIEAVRAGESQSHVSERHIKDPEWEVLTDPDPPTDWPHFLSKPAPVPKGFETRISGVLLLERLREVNALVGFTRVEAPEESGDPDERPPMADLCTDAATWGSCGASAR